MKTTVYQQLNEEFLEKKRQEKGVRELSHGILYEVVQTGSGAGEVQPRSVVTVHYKGTLINGREFDNSWKRNCPDAFRVNSLINGFQLALLRMHIGDRWRVYIPQEQGYGKQRTGIIPAFSTLVFEIELLAIV